MRSIDQIKGHGAVKDQLLTALANGRLPHALLFSGPSGIGKRGMAWGLAQNLLCSKAPACGACPSCVRVFKRQSENILNISKTSLQIRLQDLQMIRSFLSLQSFSKARAVIIDEAESLNIQSANFLLKMIEEPPSKTFFLLISSAGSSLPLTLRSRMQNIRFQALPEAVIKALAPQGTPAWMIKASGGQMDRLQEWLNREDIRTPAFDLLLELMRRPQRALSMDFPKKLHNREYALMVCRFWQEFLRDIRLIKAGALEPVIHRDKYEDIAPFCAKARRDIDRLLKGAFQMEADLRSFADYNLVFENFAMALCSD